MPLTESKDRQSSEAARKIGRTFGPILDDLPGVIASAQAALLYGELRELETCSLRQQELCHELEASLLEQMLSDEPYPSNARELMTIAASTREKNRVFSSVLRRMQMNLEAWQRQTRTLDGLWSTLPLSETEPLMSNLLATLSVATGALAAEQGALNETANNIANVNTPGYTRKDPQFAENPPVVVGPLTFGTGVSLEDAPSVRDPILQLQIQQQTGQQGQLDALVTAMKQVQAQFSNQGSDIGTQLSALFASISQLSTDPSSASFRQGVLTAASNLATTFNTTANNLLAQRSNLNLSVDRVVDQINTLTSQVAVINGKIASLQNLHQDASAFLDQRDQLVTQLSGLIDVSQIQTESGITLTTSNGSALVSGTQSFALTTQADSSGLQHIFSQGNDITSQFNSGQLGGLLAVRDQKIPAVLSSVDTLAAGLVNAFNSANAAGFDLHGNPGANLFTPPPASGQGAAASMAVAISDPALLAASSDGSAGSNGNLANFSAIHDQAAINGETPSDFYSNLIFGVGNDVSNGSAELQSSQLVLQQLQDQRGSISGVSLDEEAAHMIQYQRAYEAAARVANTVNQMLETVINMGTS